MYYQSTKINQPIRKIIVDNRLNIKLKCQFLVGTFKHILDTMLIYRKKFIQTKMDNSG